MVNRIKNVNPQVIRKCREQMGISIEEVKRKVGLISGIEAGDKFPTLNQLNELSSLYEVPRWVFISDSLPMQYQWGESIPAFRKFIDSRPEEFGHHNVRRLVARVEQLRELVIDIRNEMNESIDEFSSPNVRDSAPVADIASQIRAWLNVTEEENFDFNEWKKKLEDKNIFIFLSDKYRGWSHIDKEVFRGLSIYHSTLPIIIVNDSDSKKAQSFTLFHELGHLLRRESEIDDWSEHDSSVEIWCNKLAGNVLMSAKLLIDNAGGVINLESIKKIAKKFKVSPYACIVRLKQLEIIEPSKYSELENELINEYKENAQRLNENESVIPRNRSREVFNQYGSVYTRAIFQAYRSKEIGLHKLCKLFGLKRASHALDLESRYL